MDKIYEQSKDLHVVATRVYHRNNCAYVDAECTKQFKTSELKEVFIKGALVDGGYELFYKPVAFVDGNLIYMELDNSIRILGSIGDDVEPSSGLKSGRYTYENFTWVIDAEAQTIEGIIDGQSTGVGTYTIDGNVITLTAGGMTDTAIIVDGNIVYNDITYVYENPNNTQNSYVGTWTYTQVGEGDTGLSNGDVFNLTINADLSMKLSLYNATSDSSDIVDITPDMITETENGLHLVFAPDEPGYHLLTLVDENTLHVSLYDDSIKFDATRVA